VLTAAGFVLRRLPWVAALCVFLLVSLALLPVALPAELIGRLEGKL
jgi:hypothetical protein